MIIQLVEKILVVDDELQLTFQMLLQRSGIGMLGEFQEQKRIILVDAFAPTDAAATQLMQLFANSCDESYDTYILE